jgi:hypothetical protein
MATTNIGPCACCGNACGCSNCLWRWIYDESTMAYIWSVIDGCGGGDGSNEPCCGCPTPLRMGAYAEEEYLIACVGTNRCTCTSCDFWWDSFLLEWVPNTGCKNIHNILTPACVCPTTAGSRVGSVHGELSGPVVCGCPT